MTTYTDKKCKQTKSYADGANHLQVIKIINSHVIVCTDLCVCSDHKVKILWTFSGVQMIRSVNPRPAV